MHRCCSNHVEIFPRSSLAFLDHLLSCSSQCLHMTICYGVLSQRIFQVKCFWAEYKIMNYSRAPKGIAPKYIVVPGEILNTHFHRENHVGVCLCACVFCFLPLEVIVFGFTVWQFYDIFINLVPPIFGYDLRPEGGWGEAFYKDMEQPHRSRSTYTIFITGQLI